ncbi:MAG TPA: hypothetical protein VG167_12770 [Verrucomicrobiae bacterium]|nr:hypothetical protein [Verrucomicrobiae bacterium]
MTLVQKPTRQVRRALARRSQTPHDQRLTREIVAQGAAQTEAAALAAAVTQGGLTEAELQAWRTDYQARLQTIAQHPEQTLGHIEEAVAAAAKEPLRLLTQRAAQAKANATPCQCLECHQELSDQKYLSRGIDSRFGRLLIWRHYGWCAQCETWCFPADHALGLAKKAAASPYVQEIAGLLVTKMPPEQAVAVAQRLGLDLSRCLLHREAHRQGIKAQARRSESLAQLDTWEDLQQLARDTEGPPAAPFTLVIEIDAWNIRERDHWGQTKALRKEGKKVERWHWVYMATVFRLDHRGQTAGQRSVISQRGYVATRLGLEALMAQLYREAIQRGLGQARQVLVIADGAVWIWNLAKDRFPQARQQLDLWHAEEHLWAVAHDLHGRGTPEARTWVEPLLQQVRDDQTTAVIATLAELKPRLQEAEQKKLQTQIEYFEHNAHRMKYREIIAAREAVEAGTATPEQIQLANHPLGSGAIESTCRQYQCRFKRTGQFWTTAGDEALMCLETFWRNGRWHELYPHAKTNLALN